jgi:hypothetical protein
MMATIISMTPTIPQIHLGILLSLLSSLHPILLLDGVLQLPTQLDLKLLPVVLMLQLDL